MVEAAIRLDLNRVLKIFEKYDIKK